MVSLLAWGAGRPLRRVVPCTIGACSAGCSYDRAVVARHQMLTAPERQAVRRRAQAVGAAPGPSRTQLRSAGLRKPDATGCSELLVTQLVGIIYARYVLAVDAGEQVQERLPRPLHRGTHRILETGF